MASYSFNNNFSSGNCYSGIVDPFSRDSGPCNGSSRGRALSLSQSLVLDSEKGDLVKAPVKVGKKTVSEEKIIAALKSHSEAERRRRERINAHLDTLRTLLPCRQKMDKATLLGEVIMQLKQLKKNATEASKGLLVPMDNDEVSIEPCNIVEADGKPMVSFKASICCDYRPQLLTDLRQALDALPFPIKIVKSEISTLGSRLKNDFVFTASHKSTGSVTHVVENAGDAESWRFLACSIRQTLDSILEKASTSLEYSQFLTFPNKRRRISYIDSSSSSSCSKKG
ncbi:hypothetical protein HRI_002828200 [Hibiscus trionum]|uniref:BHLH domain-containing protein n=1 Tax=Hibiscus trionum TaxID=183268 RepID=A0A9W7I6X0_HIBTR|nr:hypothetical protein HRI_002828200 [Hibiscus trionum]